MGKFSTPSHLSDFPLQKTDLNNDGFNELVTVNGNYLFLRIRQMIRLLFIKFPF